MGQHVNIDRLDVSHNFLTGLNLATAYVPCRAVPCLAWHDVLVPIPSSGKHNPTHGYPSAGELIQTVDRRSCLLGGAACLSFHSHHNRLLPYTPCYIYIYTYITLESVLSTVFVIARGKVSL